MKSLISQIKNEVEKLDNISKKDKSIIEFLTIIALSKNPYYKDIYESPIIITPKDVNSSPTLIFNTKNDFDLKYENEPQDLLFFSPEIHKRVELIFSAINESDTLQNFKDKFKDKKNFFKIESYCINKVLFESFKVYRFLDESDFGSLYNERGFSLLKERVNDLTGNIQSLSLLENIYKSKTAQIIDNIQNNNIEITQQTNLDGITYGFFEIEKSDDLSSGIGFLNLSDNSTSSFSDLTLKRNNIVREYKGVFHFNDLCNNFSSHLKQLKNDFMEGFSIFEDNSFYLDNQKRQFLYAKKNDEIIGIVSFATFSDDNSNVFISSTTNIKSSYQGLNLSKSLYLKVGEIINENHGIFISDNYTNEGSLKLSKFKNTLNDKFDHCFFIEMSPNSESVADHNTPLGFLSDLTESFVVENLCDLDFKNNIPIIKSCYFNMLKNIRADMENNDRILNINFMKNEYLSVLKENISIGINKIHKVKNLNRRVTFQH